MVVYGDSALKKDHPVIKWVSEWDGVGKQCWQHRKVGWERGGSALGWTVG